MQYAPRWYQSESVAACWHYFCHQHGAPLIVLPTGAGKSICLAMLCRAARQHGGRVVLLAHRKELLEQNAEKIAALMPDESVGIYSAGLKQRNTDSDIVCAGIQSVYKRAEELGPRHLLLIDEAHLVPDDGEGMYRTFLQAVRESSPNAKLAGLTATPYRTGSGPLCGKDRIFRRVCYEASIQRLTAEGFLCKLTTQPTIQVDTSGIKIRGGEYVESDMIRTFDTDNNVEAACQEIQRATADRRSVLVFCAGVRHAEHVAERLGGGCVTGETFPMIRSKLLADFRSGRLKYLVSVDCLTTGFDAPNIDCIAVLRATLSPGLFAQICGRGLRTCDGKPDCLILDFGNNIDRHGTLDDPAYGRASSKQGREDNAAANNGRGKECPNCHADCPSRSLVCDDCGFEFPVKHEASAHDGEIVGDVFESWQVESVTYGEHTKKDAPPSHPKTLRVDYTIRPPEMEGNLVTEKVSEWVCFDHQGFARQKAERWWQDRSVSELPESVADAISLLDSGAAVHPSALVTKREGKYKRIESVTFTDEKPDSWEQIARIEHEGWTQEEVPF